MKTYVIYVTTAMQDPPTAEELAEALQKANHMGTFSATPPREKV